MKFKNTICDEILKFKWLQKSKTKIVTKLKNSSWEKTHSEEKNSKNQNVTKFKWWQNSKPKILTKLQHSKCDKTQKTKIVTKLKRWKISIKEEEEKTINGLLVRIFWNLDNKWDFL